MLKALKMDVAKDTAITSTEAPLTCPSTRTLANKSYVNLANFFSLLFFAGYMEIDILQVNTRIDGK